MPSDRYMDREDWSRNNGYQATATPKPPAMSQPVAAYTKPAPVEQKPVPTVMAPTTSSSGTFTPAVNDVIAQVQAANKSAPAPAPTPAAPTPTAPAPTPAAPSAPATGIVASKVTPPAEPPSVKAQIDQNYRNEDWTKLQNNINTLKMTEAQARSMYSNAEVDNAIAKGITFSSGAPTPAAPAVGLERAQVTKWDVTPEQLVNNQVNKIIAQDSPLMQQARANALMQANERGMINSSMAAGAAQAAVMDRAIDIGGRDANTQAQSGQFNANSANQNSMFNAGQANQWNTNQLDRDWKTSERQASQAFQTSERRDTQNWTSAEKAKDRQATVDQYQFDAKTRKELTELDNQYRKELNSDSSFNDQYKMYVDALYKIDSDPNLDAPAKQKLKYQQAVAFESFAKLKGLKLDLDFSGQYKPTDAPSGGSSGGGSSSLPDNKDSGD